MKIGIIDYDAGNLTSVQNAFQKLGADYCIGRTPESLKAVDKLVFPGVGEASSAMQTLAGRGLDSFIREFAASGKPLLAICIGSQIILDSSEEGNAQCLGIIPGNVKRLPPGPGLKIPHMGWNSVQLEKEHPYFQGIPDNSSFYFVHSYYTNPDRSEDILCSSEYGIRFCCALQRENITATQFHPEKSGPWGLRLLENFISFKG